MKKTLTVTDRGTVAPQRATTLPVEVYSEARIAAFDAEEADLGEVLHRKRPPSRRSRRLTSPS